MLTEHSSKKQKIDISIITVNYNLADEIEKCLVSLINVLNSPNQIGYEVIIVDNNSPDKKLPEVEEKFKKDNIHFYYLDKNLGFGKGNNFGFSKASGKYICFLNPDTVIREEIFSQVIDLFDKDKAIGVIGPKQQIRHPFFDFSAGFSPNIFIELFNLLGLGVLFEGFLMHFWARFNNGKFFEVNWILGAAIFIKAELFNAIGGFDKDYFMFYEEVDLCKRVSENGYKIIYYPRINIHHIGSVSGKKDYYLYTIRTYSSKYIFISKHYKSFYRFLMIFLLFWQVLSQVVIWMILSPLNIQKSKQKLNAFVYLLRHGMKYEHRY
jgi:GT2 family glycosyltransferase